MRNKVLKTLGYVRNFTYLDAANITSKQKSDMAKVAIKNENITSFGGIYHIMDVFSKLGFEKLSESVLGKRGSSGKAFCYGSFFCYFPGWASIGRIIVGGENRDGVTAMLKNFYLYLVRHISEKVKPLKKTSRLKAFILHLVSVPAKWVRTGRQNVLNLYTNKTYYAEVFIE